MNLPSTSTESRPNTISAHKKIKHLTKKYRRFRYLKDKRKRIDLNQFFSRRKETRELNFSNFFSKLNELDRRNEATFNLDDDLSSPNSSSLNESQMVLSWPPLAATNEDSENHLLELIKASSTITNRKAQRSQLDSQLFSSKKETKKSSAAKHKERTIGLLNEFNRHENSLAQKEDRIVNEDILVDYFLSKIKECLGKEEQSAFIKLLEQFDLVHRRLAEKLGKPETGGSRSLAEEQELNDELKQVYQKIKNLVNDSSNGELIDEFLLFMNYDIVRQLNKQFDFNYWIKVKCFVQKIVIYLNQESGSLIRLIKLLKQLKQNESDLDKKRIRSALNKFLNSQPYLLNELNSLFLEEAPQEYLFTFNEDFDEVDLEEELSKEPHNDHKFETLILNDSAEEDLYLTRDCPCKFCHTATTTNLVGAPTSDSPSASDHQSLKHCISCSLKYYKNKLYCCQENRKLHFTSIEYIDRQDDELKPAAN